MGGAVSAELAGWAARLLAGVARVNRFDTTLQFAAGETAARLRAVFDAVAALAPTSGTAGDGEIDLEQLGALRAMYRA